ncbi:hypothetical protein BFP97_00735 [Roseivirga sp. 4D4]|uniref:nuclear transport factor 2 family protein n=1 Tax=Roseivirga sp. 4D4 TaxID=1889784 RepID=UPI0008528E43|nr:nuclear transport factor 2 family protein [Roseivirga sp. 4D4]OEK00128.1 hypothetical protein BFP97_00735 [Roseivirga sp. 4D4]
MSYKEQVIDAEELLKKAMIQADCALLETLLHDEMSFAIPTGEVITKSQELQNYRSGQMKVHDLQTSDQEISEMGETVSVSVLAHLRGSYQENPIQGKFRFIRFWKMTSEGPKIIAGSSSPAEIK